MYDKMLKRHLELAPKALTVFISVLQHLKKPGGSPPKENPPDCGALFAVTSANTLARITGSLWTIVACRNLVNVCVINGILVNVDIFRATRC